jgi:orotidine-5'-phosphate decarboxylase
MTRQQLTEQIRARGSYLCVGLDTDITKIPRHLMSHADPVFEFNKQIIDATKEYCVSYKINTAFYESSGAKGWESMERTVNYIPPTHFRIADAKRGDIGNTSAQYAKAFFETLAFDAVTVAPYMGEDSIRPFLEFKDKWTILLGLTSNPGAADFELQRMREGGGGKNGGSGTGEFAGKSGEDGAGEYLYEKVLRMAAGWGTPENLMFVIGATQADWFEGIRRLTPDHFYLVPGVGSQGGSLKEVSAKAMNKDIGLLVNVSRGVIYASAGEDFAARAGAAAAAYHQEMKGYLAL